MRAGLAIQATLSSIMPLSLNLIDSVRNKYTELLTTNQFPELTRPTAKGEKHDIKSSSKDILFLRDHAGSPRINWLPQKVSSMK